MRPHHPSCLTFLFVILIISYSFSEKLYGQQIPSYPIGYRVFTPFILNPAIAGSKDYFDSGIIAGKFDSSASQIIYGSGRIHKQGEYFNSIPSIEGFTPFGAGGYFFNENYGLFRNSGVAGIASYHIQLDKNALSFLSFGISIKAIYSRYKGEPDLNRAAAKKLSPDVDLGVYYYSPSFNAGLSLTNIFSNANDSDTTDYNRIPVSKHMYGQIGYKFEINGKLDIVVEPSVIINTDLSFSDKIKDMFEPMIKVYAGSFCIGTYFHNWDNYSFLFQYNYPDFHIGVYFEIPKGSAFYKSPVLAELTLGINISAVKNGFTRKNHW